MKIKKFLSERIKFPHSHKSKKKAKAAPPHHTATEPATDVACAFTNCCFTAHDNNNGAGLGFSTLPAGNTGLHYANDKTQLCAVWINDMNSNSIEPDLHGADMSQSLTDDARLPSPPQRSKIRTNPWITSPTQSMPRRPHSARHTICRQPVQVQARPHSLQRSEERTYHRVQPCTPAAPSYTDWYHDDMVMTLPTRGFKRNLVEDSWGSHSVWSKPMPFFPNPPSTTVCCSKEEIHTLEADSAYSTLMNEVTVKPSSNSNAGINQGVPIQSTSEMSQSMVNSTRSNSQQSSISLSKSDPDSSPEHDSGLGDMDSHWGKRMCSNTGTVYPVSSHTERLHPVGEDASMVSRCTQTLYDYDDTEELTYSSNNSHTQTLPNPRKRSFHGYQTHDGDVTLCRSRSRYFEEDEGRHDWSVECLTDKVQRLCLAKTNLQNKIREAQIECESFHSYQQHELDYSAPLYEATEDYGDTLLDTIGDLQCKIDDHCETMKRQFPHLFTEPQC